MNQLPSITPADCDTTTQSVELENDNFSSDELLTVNRLDKGSKEYEIVDTSFISGMRELGNKKMKIEVVEIHKKKYDWCVMDEARLGVFRLFAAAVATRNGGDPNIKFGWFGGSYDEIKEIIMYGFRRFGDRPLPDSDGGTGGGVRLYPANKPMESVRTSIPDTDGLRHVVLCRVILGRPEIIYPGSQKNQPSSMKFDSGVNDMLSPTKYVIWERHMNTHILPLYVISFRVDSTTEMPSSRVPTSSHMSINGLIRRLTNCLSSSKMVMIKKLHHEYHKNRMSRTAFIRNLRAVAGDDVLRSLIRSLQWKRSSA